MTETTKTSKWSEEVVAKLVAGVNDESPVSIETLNTLSESLGHSVRSVAAKLRQLGYEVASTAKEKISAFSADETEQLVEFVNDNAGNLTYKEIAEKFNGGKFNAKQVQGKILSLELTGSVKPAEKVEVARTYTEDEEIHFIKLAEKGAFIEEIAEALGKTVQSVRGKALSLTRSGDLDKIPAQKESHAKNEVDPVDALGDAISAMTVAEIAKAVDKTDRGVKTLLTRRGISVKDYDGAAKKEKAASKAKAA